MTDQLPAEVAEAVKRAQAATTRSERVKRGAILYIAAVLTILAPVVGWAAVNGNLTLSAVRQTQVEGVQRSQETHTAATSSTQILRTIRSCLTAGGACYQQGQANQADVLRQVGRLYTYAGLCLNDQHVAQNAPAQEQCVAGLVKSHGLD